MCAMADKSIGEYFNYDDQHINTKVLRTFDADRNSSWKLRCYSALALYDHALFITSNGTNQLNDIPKHWRFQVGQLISIFDRITSPNVDEQRFFGDLITTYRLVFGINLYLVVNDVNNCFVIDPARYSETNFENNDINKNAFMYIIKNEWKYNSIFTSNSDGESQTLFSKYQMVHQLRLEDFLDNQVFLGKSNPVKIDFEVTSSSQEQSQNDTISTMISIVEDNDKNIDVLSQDIVVQAQCPSINVDKKISEMLDDMKRLLTTYVISPADEIIQIPSSVFNITNFEELCQDDRNAMVNNYITIIGAYCQGVTNTVHVSENEVMDTSNGNLHDDSHEHNENHNPLDDIGKRTNPIPSTVSNVTSSIGHQEEEQIFQAPIIAIHPKQEVKDRNLKDLVPKLVKSQANMKGKKNTKIGFLQGRGRQRTKPSVRIDDRAAEAEYLACQAQTIDGRPNIYKLIVPKGTTAKKKLITHENTLNCLDYSKCDTNDYFDQTNRILYLKITPQDRQARLKEIQVFLITLYQSSTITKETINEENLSVCKLAFWFCKNIGTYHPKASVSWTKEIMSIEKVSVEQKARQ